MQLPALVESAEKGHAGGREQLFTALYDELHRMAQRELRRNAAATLSPTTLLHETFLNVSQRDSAAFSSHAQFMAYAARAMRGLLINYVRDRRAQKRGGRFEITSLATGMSIAGSDQPEMARLGDALESLAKLDARLAQCVDLKFFCGFSHADIAQLWAVSERTVQRDWDKARILLNRLLNEHAVE